MTRPATAPRLSLPGLGRRAARSSDVTSDAARFEAVYRDLAPELYRYARSIVRDEHAAEDVLQSTMEKALAALKGESRDFELRPWLFRIAHNEAISRLRREKPTDALPDTVAAIEAPAADRLDDKQRLEQLWTDLATLPDRQRQALVLRELSGLSHEEIGDVLETSGRAVKQTIFEARRSLLDCSEGRAMACDDIQQLLSDGDGRVRRSRRLQSHLRTCRDCRAFDAALHERPEQLRALAPVLPAAAAASLLAQLLPGGSSGLAIGHAGGAATGAWSIGSISGALGAKATVIAVASVTAVGGAGVAAVKHERASEAPPAAAPAVVTGGAAGAAAAPAAAAARGGGNGSSGGGSVAGLGASERDADDRASGHDEKAKDAGAPAKPADRDSPQGAAGKARAAANKAAAAERRAAAKQKRAAAKAKAKAKAKPKSGSGSAGTAKGGNSGSARKPPNADAPAAKAPKADAPTPRPKAGAPAAGSGTSDGANGGSGDAAPGQSNKPTPPGKSG